ncbi:FemAB family protein [Aestuariivivens marinum]|uniref:FemAB family protein n=1 Tax=Aestuariivivens marinum TaxID=2913555 RepID=UPI001F5A5F2F|nr:FemAB family protein [Aestuariivivens marinum]
MILSIKRYKPEYKAQWDRFVSSAKNATFLFYRDFMEYHADRFEDYSLLVYKNEKLVALMPANKVSNSIYSHQGLTYGGLILEKKTSFLKISAIFDSVINFLKLKGFSKVFIKQIPGFYCSEPSYELGYYLSKKHTTFHSEMVFAIDYKLPFNIHKTKLKHFRKAKVFGFEIKENDELSIFWDRILKKRLLEKHNTKPVHTLFEINNLQNAFPNNIKQFNIYLEGEILAGITIFEMGGVVKSQYGATSLKGEKFRALDYLFLHLIYKYKKENKEYFSMGTVVENNDMGFNAGLVKQKEELGARVYLQHFFSLDLE